jgi:hypothetical protein
VTKWWCLPVAPVMDRGTMTKMTAPACSIVVICRTSKTHLQRRRAAQPQGSLPLCFLFLLFVFLSLYPVYPRSFPWPIKGKAGRPIWGRSFNTQKHFNSTSPSPETWDIIPLSPVCNPYCKPSVLVTRAAATGQTRNTNSLVGGTKHRQEGTFLGGESDNKMEALISSLQHLSLVGCRPLHFLAHQQRPFELHTLVICYSVLYPCF